MLQKLQYDGFALKLWNLGLKKCGGACAAPYKELSGCIWLYTASGALLVGTGVGGELVAGVGIEGAFSANVLSTFPIASTMRSYSRSPSRDKT